MMTPDFELTDTGRLEATRSPKKRSSDTIAINEAAVAIGHIQTGDKEKLQLMLKENHSLVGSAVDWVRFATLEIISLSQKPFSSGNYSVDYFLYYGILNSRNLNSKFLQAGDGLLAIASWHGMPEIVSMLLNDFSANVNAENLQKSTPLHRASAGGCSLCVEILLNRGADVEFCDANGRKPIDVGGNDAVRELIRVRRNDFADHTSIHPYDMAHYPQWLKG